MGARALSPTMTHHYSDFKAETRSLLEGEEKGRYRGVKRRAVGAENQAEDTGVGPRKVEVRHPSGIKKNARIIRVLKD